MGITLLFRTASLSKQSCPTPSGLQTNHLEATAKDVSKMLNNTLLMGNNHVDLAVLTQHLHMVGT